ncbi:hypothetical protein CC78DRAFT_620537 [Lojkania enalia]|uniref:F-box domain-containing protein n=1 Tax=Lojkania enalia TaxID=147567 RepID=A0A9P4JZD6_9PLEO|nr:hypothetical protein CC78DRAFT_620537 [Didymosphaeria enalia]
MVVIVDLDDDASSNPALNASSFLNVKPLHHSLAAAGYDDGRHRGEEVNRPNPNINGFSAALSCYPIVRQLASQLDLNSLHNLSRTCRQFRANLLEYRDQLVKRSLRCVFEDADMGSKLARKLKESHSTFSYARQLMSGKVGKCARDMVSECQRCGGVVCRNCIIKPPPAPATRRRHRRLCRACTKAPLHLLTASPRSRSDSNSTPSPPASPDPRPPLFDDNVPHSFTAPAFERTPCCCDTLVWLCQPCGQQLKNADDMYMNAWNWRTQFTHHNGGYGVGAGEGNEGVECGRTSSCLAAKIVEHETDCDAVALSTRVGKDAYRRGGPSYHAQEIEGIGGVFKMKSKKQVRVGECVKFYEDEKERRIQCLEREVNGKLRSWCSWCQRVVLGGKDLAAEAGERPLSSGASSASSDR